MRSNGIKIDFFQKITEVAQRLKTSLQTPIATGCWGLRPRLPSVIRLSYTSSNFFQLKLFCFLTFGLKPSSFSKILVNCQTKPRLLIFHSTISLPHKKFLFQRFLMTSLHVICNSYPPSKNPGYAYGFDACGNTHHSETRHKGADKRAQDIRAQT